MSDARKRKLQASLSRSSDLPESLRFIPSTEPPTNGPHAKKLKTAAPTPVTPPNYDTRLLNLQAEQLLKATRQKDAEDKDLAKLAASVEKQIMAIVDGESLKLSDIRALSKKRGVTIPFIVQPPDDLQLNFTYAAPNTISRVGIPAVPLHNGTKAAELELLIEVPSEIVQEKDYLNHRIHHKLAFYLFTIAYSMKTKYDLSYQIRTSFGIPQVVLVVKYREREVVLQLSMAPDCLDQLKLGPMRNALRASEDATPEYNASVLLFLNNAILYTSLQDAAAHSPGFSGSILLARKYLSNRKLDVNLDQWAAVTAALLIGGGKNGGKVLSPNASALQLFRGTLLFLSNFFSTLSESISFGDVQAEPGCWIRSFNLFARMTDQRKIMLAHEFRSSSELLNQEEKNPISSFEKVFLEPVDILGRWDLEIRIEDSACISADTERIWRTLRKALGDRASLIRVARPQKNHFAAVSQALAPANTPLVQIGIQLKTPECQGTLVLGPPANASEAKSFRGFWGALSELRKFKDGRILESVVLSKTNPSLDICQKIMGLHFPDLPSAASWSAYGVDSEEEQRLLRNQKTLASEFDEFARLARELENLPLRTTNIASSDSIFSGCASAIPENIDGVIQFESSARWPDDLEAIQRTKLAFLLAMRTPFATIPGVMDVQVCLENQLSTGINSSSIPSIVNNGILRVSMSSGIIYNLRIHFDREKTLLTSYLRSATAKENPQTKDHYLAALAYYERVFVTTERHSQYSRKASSDHPAYAGSVVLLKCWFAAHLLFDYFSERAIELIGLHCFINDAECSNQSPVSVFYRTMRFLSAWDWRQDALFLDVDLERFKLNESAFDSLKLKDPGHSLTIYPPYEGDVVSVEKVAALRMTGLAKATHDKLQAFGSISSTLITPLSHFDCVITLADDRKSSKYRNIKSSDSESSKLNRLLKQELRDVFGHFIYFFTAEASCQIALLVDPALHISKRFRPNLGYATKQVKSEDGSIKVVFDMEGTLAEIERLGHGLITKIQRKLH